MLLALAVGCAGIPTENNPEAEFSVAVHSADLPTLTGICSHREGVETDLEGCYQWRDNVCHIYTLPRWVFEARKGIEAYHEAVGHELDHCLREHFHGEHKGISLPGQFNGRLLRR